MDYETIMLKILLLFIRNKTASSLFVKSQMTYIKFHELYGSSFKLQSLLIKFPSL